VYEINRDHMSQRSRDIFDLFIESK